MMVGPRLFQPVGQFFNRANSFGFKEHHDSSRSTNSANQHQHTFHSQPISLLSAISALAIPTTMHSPPQALEKLMLNPPISVFPRDRRHYESSPNRYTSTMDSVRFGRALGFGARSAAKALAGAVDAATAPSPSAPKPSPKPATRPAPAQPALPSAATPPATTSAAARPSGPIATAARTAARTTIQARQTTKEIARGSKRFGEAVWGPVVKLSGVLWLEITGVFFGIFALFAAQAAWNHRADFRLTAVSSEARTRAFIFLAMTLVFGYFCLSSFIRARRRERSQ